MAEPTTATERLNHLVERCTEAWDQQGASLLADLCSAHPDLAEPLRRRIGILQQAGLLTPLTATGPRRLGDFRLEGELGAGGMGVVHLATQVSLGRRVALKIIRPEQSFFDVARKRFLREAEAVARLQHPGIVPVHVVGEEAGVLYYAMDLVEGCTLAQALAHLRGREPSTLVGEDLRAAVRACSPATPKSAETGDLFGATWAETCLRLAKRVAEALDHAHGRGVLHRDVKPSNVMVTADGRVLLVDFGLASAEGDVRITRSGAQVGSLAYMAPEQVRGEHGAIGRPTDVYGVGLLLYEALSLTQPFASESSERTRQAVLTGRPPALRAHNRALSADVALVCQKAMDQDPSRRYATAADFALDVANVLALRPIQARAPGLWLRIRRAARRHPARAVTLAFVALLTLVVFPALYVQQLAVGRELRDAKERVDAALLAADAARVRAEEQAARARFGLGKAREAVDRFLADIGQFRAVDVPLLEDLRRDTLREALALYEQLLADAGPASAELTRDRDRTRFSLAQVLRELGRSVEAERALSELLATLGEPAPDEALEVNLLRAQANSALGATRWGLSRTADAEEPLLRAQEALRSMGVQGHDPTVTTLLLRNTVQLAQLRATQERLDEASALFAEAVAIEAGDDRLDLQRIRADAHAGLAGIAELRSEVDAALEQHDKAIGLRRAMVARAPSSARFRQELASALERTGLMLQSWRPSAHATALDHLVEAGSVRAELVRDFPRNTTYRVDACRSRLAAASLRETLGAPGDAEREIRAAIDGLEQVRTEVPAERGWREPLGFARYTLARILQAQGRTDDAAVESERALALAREQVADPAAADAAPQLLAEILCARSGWAHVPTVEALELAREAFALGLGFLREHPDNSRLRGTAYRCFDNLATLLLASGDPKAVVTVADAYRDANPYKWQSQMTLARVYLRARDLARAEAALAARCLDEACVAVGRAAQHRAAAVLKVEEDEVFAPIRLDPRVQALLAAARSPKD